MSTLKRFSIWVLVDLDIITKIAGRVTSAVTTEQDVRILEVHRKYCILYPFFSHADCLKKPKYWCKHCKTYVRDTKLEKTNHEATPKHQGNLKRFLRDLYKGHEKDAKDKERAKSEVARLNSLVAGGGSGAGSSSSSVFGRGPTPSLPKQQATESQRKAQLSQLAEMGVSIPDEFRPDMAMAGEWQVTAERVIDEDKGEKKPDALALGVRKRILDEEEQELAEAKKKRWGSSYRTHPAENDEEDLDALLSNATRKGKELEAMPEGKEKVEVELAENGSQVNTDSGFVESLETPKDLIFKQELSDDKVALHAADPLEAKLKPDGEEQPVPGVVFKKRKARNIRQK